jgi:NAD(P)-dependent dehydrogenase (short-subunit alcohol dehydrogenase family)
VKEQPQKGKADERDVEGTTAVVTGASKGFGRAVAATLIESGVTVVGLAATVIGCRQPRTSWARRFLPITGDATDPGLATRLLDTYRPQTVILNAGAVPTCRPLPRQTWETFSANWESDVRQAFNWTREALLMPLAPGSTVITFSSGAALNGSPLSGGYAGAKSTVRFITAYAAEEAHSAGSDIRFITVLPKLTPSTDLGSIAVAGYARRGGLDVDTYLDRLGPTGDASAVANHVPRTGGQPVVRFRRLSAAAGRRTRVL